MEKKTANWKTGLNRYLDLWLPVVLWATVIFLFSSFPTKPVSEIHLQDFIVKKTAHVVEYAVFTLLLYRALKESGVSKPRSAAIAILGAVFYGFADEFHQSFTPGREPKLRDVMFDTIGSIGSIYLLWNLLPKLPKRVIKLAEKLDFL